MAVVIRRWMALPIFVVVTFAVAAISGLTSPDAWYEALRKPWFNPPAVVFAPVWTVLYLLMAIAAWRVWRQADGWCAALSLWLLQLLLNGTWSPLFFGLHRIDLALLDSVLLLVALVATIVGFHRRDRIAAWLLLPYLAWTSFATLLTFSLLKLNPAN